VLENLNLAKQEHLATENANTCCGMAKQIHHNVSDFYAPLKKAPFPALNYLFFISGSTILIYFLISQKRKKELEMYCIYKRYRNKSSIFNNLYSIKVLFSSGILNPKVF
jgi:hypothetical protein